jgi:hypothetical protein
LGEGEESFTPLVDGGEIQLVLGGQGLFMFPMPLRGEGFEVPDDPLDFDDPKAPRLSLVFDIDEFDTAYGDHFAKITDLPLPLTQLPGGGYEFIYLPVIAPNDFGDMCEVHEHPAQVSATLSVAGGGAPLSYEVELIVIAPLGPGESCI